MSSDSVSTTLSNTSSSKFSFFQDLFNFNSQDLYRCYVFNIKVILFIIFVILVTSCLLSSIGSITGDNNNNNKREHFANDQFFSYKDTINPNYSNYQITYLSPIDNDDGSPGNLFSGEASRIITIGENGDNSEIDSFLPAYVQNNQNTLYLDVYANLLILEGNPFVQYQDIKSPLQYRLYLVNTVSNTKLFVDKLYKDGDGRYKLKLKTTNVEKYMNYNEVQIVYFDGNNESILLHGKFTLA